MRPREAPVASCYAVAKQPSNQSNQGHERCLTTMLQGRGSRAYKRTQAVMAGVLQDHIMRSLTHLQGSDLPSPSTRLTLAQKLGLVAVPSSRRLTADEWTEVKSRSLLNGGSAHPCIICTEEFRLQPQVLLSCSHVFHKECLRKLERVSGKKCCPLCRTEPYETRVIHDGAIVYREKCAVRIQAWWRGCITLRWYRDMRKVEPPRDPQQRRRFFEEKFQEMSEVLVRSCLSGDVDSFLSDVDRSVAHSRDVFRLFDLLHAGAGRPEEEEWTKAQEKAFQRDTRDCPICLTSLRSEHSSPPVVLLSCSHLFHQACLKASEHFCQEGGATCPLCRSHYVSVLVYGAARPQSK